MPSNVASIPSQPSVIKRKPQHALCPISPTATNDSNGGPKGEAERSQAIIGLERNSTTCQTVARHGGSRHPNSAGAGRNANLQAFVENTTGQSTLQGGGGGGRGHSVGEVEEPVGKYPVALVRPPVYMEEELHAADPKLQEFVAADWKLIKFSATPSTRMMVLICMCELQWLWVQAGNGGGKRLLWGHTTSTTSHVGMMLTNSQLSALLT